MTLVWALLGMLIGMIISFIATLILYKEEGPEVSDQKDSNKKAVEATVSDAVTA